MFKSLCKMTTDKEEYKNNKKKSNTFYLADTWSTYLADVQSEFALLTYTASVNCRVLKF